MKSRIKNFIKEAEHLLALSCLMVLIVKMFNIPLNDFIYYSSPVVIAIEAFREYPKMKQRKGLK